MKYSFKKLPDSIIEAEVVLEHKEFLEYYQPVYDAALQSVHLKGFRPGTAPKEMAEKSVDKEKVFEEAADKTVRDNLQEITEDNNWQLIAQPKVEITETNPQANLGLKYKLTLTVFPEVKLGDYKKIAREELKNKKVMEVKDGDIQKTIDWVLNSRAKLVRVNREARKGDAVKVQFSGTVKGKAAEGLTEKNDQFILGQGKFIAGFEEKIEERKEGDNLEFSLSFPEDYWKEDLRGQEVDFKATVQEVFDRQLPELTDEFVKNLGKFEKAEDFKNSVREGLKKELEEKEKERIRLVILEKIITNSKMEIPKIMTDKTLGNMLAEYQSFSGAEPKDEESRKMMEAKARNSVAGNLVLYQLAKDEKLEPSQEEIEAETSKFLANAGLGNSQNIDQQKIYDYTYGVVKNRKVFEYLEGLK
ncbi:MAG: trigger factor [Candidatus Harrisonbacteria bacterium RIFCSPLOWO2_02_FULL_41_11]|uniref:Trigger factor n=1 Tax=Candidatus Harrisonbacteria bacterium RIFCSPHIGHO2_02_FULL_42_16 TaxID=1798404 RepID=A0A1G1ZGE5_9BACT|nr:MAG: trigger factor [Candidatus Harrisonbacteria bacterium RIFCSPHIGHO2_02_FULL_42_16]OGY65777.1 MAG: trigger factor [Candidatus Harrisonbacteria bacterium RIFCSPLOWO2_02_FULL_41_11]